MEMPCLQKINYMNYYITYIMKMRGLSVEDLCGEIRHFQKLGRGKIFLTQSQSLCP